MKLVSWSKYLNGYNLLFLIIILSAICFGLFLFKEQFYFYFDQARDAFEAYAIYHNHDLKIQGPATDIVGVYHGVGWYYFLAIPYLIGGENPNFAGLFLFFLIFLTLPIVWRFSMALFSNKAMALTSVTVYAFSPALQLAARWLSNPSLALILYPSLLLLLWRFVEKQDTRKAFLIGIIFGLLLHSNLAYLISMFCLPLVYLIFKLRIRILEILVFCFGFLLPVTSFILVEIKFRGKGFQSLLEYFTGSSSIINLSLFLKTSIEKFGELFSFGVFGIDLIFILIPITLWFVIIFRKLKSSDKKPLFFLIAWLSSLVLFLLFDTGISRSKFVFFPYLIPTVFIFVFILYKTFSNKIIFILLIILVLGFQLKSNLNFIRFEINPYTVQKGMTLSNLERAIDFTYSQSRNKEFVINSITSPLYINSTWAYLYEFYGAKKYGYVPFWDGKNQTGYLGNLPTGMKADNRFTIIEPGPGIPEIFIKKTLEEEDIRSAFISEEKFGNIVVQKRSPRK